MTDQRRALLTEREREILAGEADITENYRYSVESRVRSRLRDRLAADIEVIREYHPEIFDEIVYPTVCQPDTEGETEREPADKSDEAAASTSTAPAPTDRSADDITDDSGPYADVNTDAVAAVRDADGHVSPSDIKEYVEDDIDISPDSWWNRHGVDAIKAAGGSYTHNKGWEIEGK